MSKQPRTIAVYVLIVFLLVTTVAQAAFAQGLLQSPAAGDATQSEMTVAAAGDAEANRPSADAQPSGQPETVGASALESAGEAVPLCAREAKQATAGVYRNCVRQALSELRDRGELSPAEYSRRLAAAYRAYRER